MSTRSRRSEAGSRYSRGTIVSVLAECFDAEDADGDDRWSSKFPHGGRQELYGVIDKVYATRCDVYFFYDKMTTKIDVESLTVKDDQDTVVLEDGTEFRREGFCRLVPLDGEKCDERLANKNSDVQTVESDTTAFDFEPVMEPLRIQNQMQPQTTAKRKVSDSIVFTLNPKRLTSDTTEVQPNTNDPVKSLDCEVLPTAQQVPAPSTDQVGESSTSTSLEVRRTRIKKLPIYKRPVKNLEEAEKEENYDSARQDAWAEKTVSSVIKDGVKKNATVRSFQFSTKKKKQVRRSQCDIVVGKPGPTSEAKSIVEPEQAFDYYFPPELQSTMVSFANKRIVNTLRHEARLGKCKCCLLNYPKLANSSCQFCSIDVWKLFIISPFLSFSTYFLHLLTST